MEDAGSGLLTERLTEFGLAGNWIWEHKHEIFLGAGAVGWHVTAALDGSDFIVS